MTRNEKTPDLFGAPSAREALARIPRGTMTDDEIQAAATGPAGWSKAQLAQWGVPWPPPKGWRARLAGRD